MKNRVRQLREQQGSSQGQLAQQVGVSRQTINSMEVERYTPSLPLALALARYRVINRTMQAKLIALYEVVVAVARAVLVVPGCALGCGHRCRYRCCLRELRRGAVP